jgi:hypothetical protein
MRIAYVTHVAFPDVVGDPFHSLELARKMTGILHVAGGIGISRIKNGNCEEKIISHYAVT